MSVMHYVVTLFATTGFDGVSVSIFIFDTIASTDMMILLSQQTNHPQNFFLLPTADCPKVTKTPTYNLRCFSKTQEHNVSPFSSFAAAHVLYREKQVVADMVVIFEGTRRMEFPRAHYLSGQIQCRMELPKNSISRQMLNMERIIIMDLFGIARRGVVLEYLAGLDTLVVYDVQSTREQIMRLAPKLVSKASREFDGLKINTVVVCVADRLSGGTFARSFFLNRGYAELDMPVPATPYLRNIGEPNESGLPAAELFEITWISMGQNCRLIKTILDKHPRRDFVSGSEVAVFMAETETIQAQMI